MKTKKLTDFKFLNLFKVDDPENGVNGYFYAERLGKDSIAFICVDKITNLFLINEEFKPPVGQFIKGAFGGSLDKTDNLIHTVIDEVEEETGFSPNSFTRGDIKELGKVFVSTQMNQFCHLFLVFVNGLSPRNRKPENAVEASAKTYWVNEKEIMEGEDWKAISIISRAKAKRFI